VFLIDFQIFHYNALRKNCSLLRRVLSRINDPTRDGTHTS